MKSRVLLSRFKEALSFQETVRYKTIKIVSLNYKQLKKQKRLRLRNIREKTQTQLIPMNASTMVNGLSGSLKDVLKIKSNSSKHSDKKLISQDLNT